MKMKTKKNNKKWDKINGKEEEININYRYEEVVQ